MSNQRHGVTDLPIRWDREEEDLLNISRYLQGLKRYVRNCPTPLSIAGGLGDRQDLRAQLLDAGAE